MKDANGNALAVGDAVDYQGQRYIVDGFDDDLVICKWPPAKPAPPIDPEMPPPPIVDDPVRVRFVASELVKA